MKRWQTEYENDKDRIRAVKLQKDIKAIISRVELACSIDGDVEGLAQKRCSEVDVSLESVVEGLLSLWVAKKVELSLS